MQFAFTRHQGQRPDDLAGLSRGKSRKCQAGPSLGLIVHPDDAEREAAYDTFRSRTESPVPVTPQPGLKIAPGYGPVGAAARQGRPFSCPGRGPQDHEQLLKNSPELILETIQGLKTPDFAEKSCSDLGIATRSGPKIPPRNGARPGPVGVK